LSDNWIITNLENALSTWNDKLSEVWLLITETPQNFKGGAIWTTIVDINGALQAIGYGLLVLFFAMGIFRSTASFKDFQRPEYALKHFIRFVLAKTAITYALDIMTGIFSICGGIAYSESVKAPTVRAVSRMRSMCAPAARTFSTICRVR